MLGFECTIKPQNLIKIVWAILEKIKFFLFFLMWTTLNFRGRGKTKKTAGDIYKRTQDIEFERDRYIGLGSTTRDGQTDRHTHTQTFFLKHIFRLWEWCRTKNHKKKSNSNFLTIAILPSLLMSLESKKKIHCFYCLLFGGQSVWSKACHSDLKHLSEKLTRRPLKVLKSCFCNRFPFCLIPYFEINRKLIISCIQSTLHSEYTHLTSSVHEKNKYCYYSGVCRMVSSPGELSEELVMQEKRKKGWRMNCDVGQATERLENELWRR